MEETAATAEGLVPEDTRRRRRPCYYTASLPEDHVREILLRVDDAAALFRCAVTCRWWSRLVADSSFLRRRWPHTSSAFLAGYLSREQKQTTPTELEATTATTFVPTPRSVLGPGRRSLGALFPGDACFLDNAVPLTARRGLLLVRLASDPIHADQDEPTVVRLAVCNLLVGACEVLPPLSGQVNFSKSGYAILTSADCSSSIEEQLSPSPTLSKVIIIGTPNLYTFSASEARWAAPRKLSFDTAKTAGIGGSLRHSDALVCGGTVHLLAGKWSSHSSNAYAVEVDTETCRVSRTKITAPTNYYPYDEPQLRVTADGRLSALSLRRPSLDLEIYVRQDSKTSKGAAAAGWVSINDIVKLKPPEQTERREKQMAMVMLGLKGGMVLLRDSRFAVYTGDLETGAMNRVVESLCPINREKVVLLEMDWRALFAHRLGKW